MITALTLGNATAIEWSFPESGDYDEDVLLSFQTTQSAEESVDLYYQEPGSSEFVRAGPTESEGNNNYTYEATDSLDGTGQYEFRGVALNTDGDFVENTSDRQITLDGQSPSVDVSPEGLTSEEDPTVSFDASDQHSGVDSSTEYIEVLDSNDDEVESDSSSSVDLDNLDEEEYTVNYEVADSVGNWNNDSWTFTVDTSYEGDTEPELEWDTTVNDNYVQMDEDVELTLTYEDQDENPATARCFDGDADDDDNEIDEDEVDDLEAVCEFDENDFADGQDIDLTIQSCDEAGNCETYNAGTYTFDKNDPELESVSSDASAVNSDFEVSFEATDSSELQGIEYFFEPTVESGEGNSVDIESNDEDVSSTTTVDTSDMESGEDRTVYFRVRDSAGRWSNIEQIEVDYFPEASADLGLSVPESVDSVATNRSTIEITVNNNGKVPAEDIGISFSGLVSDSVSIDRIGAGGSDTVTWSFTPEKSDIGEKQIQVSLDGYDVSSTVEVRVMASASQQESISSKLSTYQDRLNSLKQNTSSLNQKLGQSLRERLESNVTSFESSISEADQAVESGEYYRAQEILSNIDTDYSAARTSYQEVKDKYQSNQQQMMIMGALGGFLLLLVGGGAVAYKEGLLENYDIDTDLELTAVTEKVENLDIDFGGDSEGEEESEDEFKWDGFD